MVQGQALSDEVAALELEDCPIRMVSHPAGRLLVLALGGGGLCRVDLTVPEHGGAPVLALATGVACAAHATHPREPCSLICIHDFCSSDQPFEMPSQCQGSLGEAGRMNVICCGVAWAKILSGTRVPWRV